MSLILNCEMSVIIIIIKFHCFWAGDFNTGPSLVSPCNYRGTVGICNGVDKCHAFLVHPSKAFYFHIICPYYSCGMLSLGHGLDVVQIERNWPFPSVDPCCRYAESCLRQEARQ